MNNTQFRSEEKRLKKFTVHGHDRSKKVIVYGAGAYGEIAYYALKKLGIDTSFFCDRAPISRKLGVLVIKPEDICKFINEEFIIASADAYYEMYSVLQEVGCSTIYSMSELFSVDLSDYPMSDRARDYYDNCEQYLDAVNRVDVDEIWFSRLQVVVTERCSLRCRDCSHLMPYYTEAEDLNLEEYDQAFSRFFRIIGGVSELRILGGEPFMNRQWDHILDHCRKHHKIGTISVFTNGTIVPEEMVLAKCKDMNVRIHISDYGTNTQSIKRLIDQLESMSIRYYVRRYETWQDSGGLEYRGSSEEDLQKRFIGCFERNSFTFYRGCLFHCARAAHGMHLGAIPQMENEYVDFDSSKKTDEELSEQIRQMKQKKFTEACNYCSGPSYHGKSIPAGVQVCKPLVIAKE